MPAARGSVMDRGSWLTVLLCVRVVEEFLLAGSTAMIADRSGVPFTVGLPMPNAASRTLDTESRSRCLQQVDRIAQYIEQHLAAKCHLASDLVAQAASPGAVCMVSTGSRT